MAEGNGLDFVGFATRSAAKDLAPHRNLDEPGSFLPEDHEFRLVLTQGSARGLPDKIEFLRPAHPAPPPCSPVVRLIDPCLN
jgi:hypothetical protein